MRNIRSRLGAVAAAVTVGALALSGCGASNSNSDSGSGGGASSTNDIASKYANCSLTDGRAPAGGLGAGDDKNITIGAFSGWDESAATAYLMKDVLQKNGYTVDIKTLDAAAGFTAASKGDVDVLTDVWLPKTHKTYIDRYGNQLEPLSCWYDSAKLTIAVNNSSPAQSIGDLKTMASQFNNTLVGIEPGAGETGIVKNDVIPQYGLQGLNFTTSSTAAMLASIRKAEADGSNVAVTLWKPHWAYSAFKIRDLADPKGALGGKEGIWSWATKGFSEKAPKAAQLFKNLVLPDADLSELENLMTQKYAGNNPDGAVTEWLNNHPEFANQIAAGQLK
ncbi:glycine betaine ABC transporter substrate-binding protein [Gordonia sp. DT30]|uniref:glycine betaine ABC transporter substrate-binding protein n=1 Tax=unclassified Gordonia (in: high G+C Gram-positive bacteria) TaxID=2657482 RepID=UPI003CEE7149